MSGCRGNERPAAPGSQGETCAPAAPGSQGETCAPAAPSGQGETCAPAVSGSQENLRQDVSAPDRDCRIRLLEGAACLEAEPLWREVFSEDTPAFTDYYFSHKAKKNRGLVLEGEDGIRAMLYLTPERMKVGEREVESAYVVGVATKSRHRHKGYMATLLQTAFSLLQKEAMPFLFLMPASPDIYTPFDFTYIYEKPVWDPESLQRERLTVLGKQDAERMAEFAARFLEREKTVYVCRDRAYYITQVLELGAQNGCALGYEDEDGALQGLCLYTCENETPEVEEVLALPGTEELFVKRKPETEPVIMARIIHLERLLSMVKGKRDFSFLLAVRDERIAENDGIFSCQVSTMGTAVKRCSGAQQPDVQIGIAGLAEILFGYRKAQDPFLSQIQPFSPVWINEIV